MEGVGVLCNSCFDWGQVSGAQIRIQHLWFKVKSIAMLRSTLELSKGEKKKPHAFRWNFPCLFHRFVGLSLAGASSSSTARMQTSKSSPLTAYLLQEAGFGEPWGKKR
jgi:hypothetical protein